jgi:hypothetical protein
LNLSTSKTDVWEVLSNATVKGMTMAPRPIPVLIP